MEFLLFAIPVIVVIVFCWDEICDAVSTWLDRNKGDN